MIYRDGRYFILQCDCCSNVADEFEDFQDAVAYKGISGWRSRYLGDDCWADVCPNCWDKGVPNG